MKHLEKASELKITNKDLRIAPTNDILRKRALKDQVEIQARNPTNINPIKSKKLKIEKSTPTLKKTGIKPPQKPESSQYRRILMSHEDYSLKLFNTNLKYQFTKENLEHFLCFDLGKWT